ncbi:radical SAM/SPASM domain-containing protein [Nonomuraea wenchangensis]|uniref:radical SAM/SPASM domain-containing protein n=1 Tax=Nonomuraea wenchangensis TaxID=568860 RepID=UPI00332F380A
MELELTGRCALRCTHCYASSGPRESHGSMTAADWADVINATADMRISQIQFIGGEATGHPAFPVLLRQAVGAGLSVEIFTNLLNIRRAWWDELFSLPGVSLATSYYSDDAKTHDRITGLAGSHARTRANIAQAVRHSIPIRAAIVEVIADQRVERAAADLMALGVTRIGTDRVRGIGHGASTPPRVAELCGRCGRTKAAVSPDGEVWPCVMARWMSAGNVRATPLADILGGDRWRSLVSTIPRSPHRMVCNPDCKPAQGDGSDCAPAETDTCGPSYCEPDF